MLGMNSFLGLTAITTLFILPGIQACFEELGNSSQTGRHVEGVCVSRKTTEVDRAQDKTKNRQTQEGIIEFGGLERERNVLIAGKRKASIIIKPGGERRSVGCWFCLSCDPEKPLFRP